MQVFGFGIFILGQSMSFSITIQIILLHISTMNFNLNFLRSVVFLLTQSKNYQGNLFWHYFKNKYERYTYLLKDVTQHWKRKLKIVPSAVHINNVISWLILNIENCFFAVSNWESDMRNRKKFKSYSFKTDRLQFSENAQKQIEWDSLTALRWEK